MGFYLSVCTSQVTLAKLYAGDLNVPRSMYCAVDRWPISAVHVNRVHGRRERESVRLTGGGHLSAPSLRRRTPFPSGPTL